MTSSGLITKVFVQKAIIVHEIASKILGDGINEVNNAHSVFWQANFQVHTFLNFPLV